jgi:hypothetical protein
LLRLRGCSRVAAHRACPQSNAAAASSDWPRTRALVNRLARRPAAAVAAAVAEPVRRGRGWVLRAALGFELSAPGLGVRGRARPATVAATSRENAETSAVFTRGSVDPRSVQKGGAAGLAVRWC